MAKNEAANDNTHPHYPEIVALRAENEGHVKSCAYLTDLCQEKAARIEVLELQIRDLKHVSDLARRMVNNITKKREADDVAERTRLVMLGACDYYELLKAIQKLDAEEDGLTECPKCGGGQACYHLREGRGVE